MSIKAWPFLISRNKVLDYRPIVVPQPLLEKKASILLTQLVGGTLSTPGTATYREVYSKLLGNISLVFQIVRAEHQHIGLSGDDVLRDEVGRPINLIEGLVLEGTTHKSAISRKDLLEAHRIVEPIYQEFWRSGEHIPTIKSSHHIYLSGQANIAERLMLKEEPSLDMRKDESHTTDTKFIQKICDLVHQILQM